MKSITYRVSYQTQHGTQVDKVTVNARNINSGFSKATAQAVRGLPVGWEVVSVAFWEVN